MRIRQHVATFVFIAAAIGLSVYAYLDRDAISDPERVRRMHNLFPAFRREQVTRIELGEPGQKPMVLERDPGDGGETSWRMTSPLSAKVDLPAVDNLVGVLEYASPVRKLDRDPPGFDPIRRTGTVTMGALVYRFALGGASPSPEGSSYLRLDGEGTFVIARELTADLMKSTDVYRDKTIVPYLSINLSSLAVTGKTESWSIKRIDPTSFRLDDGNRCSRETIDLVWSALAEMRAESFLPDDVADRATESPEYRIVMTPSDKGFSAGEIVVGGPCPDHPEDVVVVRRAPTRLSACAPRGILRGLSTPKAQLDDKRLFVARPDEVEELRLETSPSGAALEIARRGTGWHQRRPADRDLTPGEAEMATALVTALTKAEGTLQDPFGKAPFTPRARATIARGGDTRVEEVVEIGEVDGVSVARRKVDGGLLTIGRDVRRLLSARATALAERRVFDPPIEGKPIAGVETRCGGFEQTLVREGPQFQMKRPPGYPADQAGAIDLGETIARAKAETRVADADDGSFGFEVPCTIAVTVKDGGGTRRVALSLGSATADGGVYAHAEGAPDVFVLRGPLLELAKTPLVDRNLFFAAPASVQAIRFTRAEGDIVVHNFADGGTHPAIESLGQLTADRVVHLGPAHPDEGFGKPTADVRIGFVRDAGMAAKHFLIGGMTKDKSAWYVRSEGIDATFLVSTAKANAVVAAARGL
ncbi:MAG: hypothetical protein JWM74_4995 [Myxococcaceae bacterium]|nr:hypothetical protein [Myxococcaceae bacterium]